MERRLVVFTWVRATTIVASFQTLGGAHAMRPALTPGMTTSSSACIDIPLAWKLARKHTGWYYVD